MSERTDERTIGDDVDPDVDVDNPESDVGAGPTGEVGFDDDELGVDVDALTGDPDANRTTERPETDEVVDEGPGLLSRLRPSGLPNPLAGIPSGRSVLLTFGAVLVSVVLASSVPLLGFVGGPVGVFAGAFVLGLASGTARYVEFALAGALVGSIGAFQGSLFRVALLSDVGLAPVVALAGGVGLVVALLGHYFGRDLRNGLTASVE
ncbi:MAG: hypothetical protein V5A44_07850 [Haloarculaceae archaeon]